MDKQGIISTVKAARSKKFAQKRKKETHNLINAVQDNGRNSLKPHKSPSGLVAEDLLLSLLLKNPDIYKTISERLSHDVFANGDNRAIFSVLMRRLGENMSIGPAFLSQELNSAQMSRIGGFLAKSREFSLLPAQADEYIRAMLAAKDKKTSDEVREMTEEEYRRYIASLQAGKIGRSK